MPDPPARPPARQAPSPNRPNAGEGIAVSIGPVNADNEVLKWWVTFPVTPAEIPVAGDANYSGPKPRAAPGYGAPNTFIGPATEQVAFDGRLEPPLYYLRNGTRTVDGINVGTLNPDAEENLAKAILSGNSQSRPYPARIGRGDLIVVMDTGARAGPSQFFEPHAFRALLSGIRDRGEIIRLVIGDQYGWNERVQIPSFTWRWSDPDPDVLLYSVTFTTVVSYSLGTVGKDTGSSAPASCLTRKDDTLSKIAGAQLHDAEQWRALLKLNSSNLARLYQYPPIGSESLRGHLLSDHKIEGRPVAPKVGSGGVKRISPDDRFTAGIPIILRRGGARGNTISSTSDVISVSSSGKITAGVTTA
jgi:hypothetical protein